MRVEIKTVVQPKDVKDIPGSEPDHRLLPAESNGPKFHIASDQRRHGPSDSPLLNVLFAVSVPVRLLHLTPVQATETA